jgi:hypothetical protein
MDETLIHCVDDVENDDPDVVLEIDFPDEETVYVTEILLLKYLGWNQYQTLCDGMSGRSQPEFLSYRIHS